MAGAAVATAIAVAAVGARGPQRSDGGEPKIPKRAAPTTPTLVAETKKEASQEETKAEIAAGVPPTTPAAPAKETEQKEVEAKATLPEGIRVPSEKPDNDGWSAFLRFIGAGLEVFTDVAKSGGASKSGWEYRKGIEGMSLGSLHYEMLTTDEESADFDRLQKEYERGWQVPFVNLARMMGETWNEIADILNLGILWISTVNILETMGVDGEAFDGIPVQNKWMSIVQGYFSGMADGDAKENGRKMSAFLQNIVTGQMERVAGAPMPVFLEEYGNKEGIYKIVIGPRSVVVVSDPVVLKRILQNSKENYTKGILSEVLEPIMGKGLIPADPITWKSRRRAIVPGFHKKWLAETTDLMVQCAENLCDELEYTIKASSANMATVNMEEKFTSASLDIIGKAIFDYDFGSVERESPVIRAVYSVLREAERRAQSVIPYWDLPGATKVFPDQKSHNENLMLLNAVLDELIRKAMKEPDQEFSEDNPHLSMLQYLVQTRNEDVTTRQLRDDLMTLLIAGHETTAACLTWTLHELMKPECKHILDELLTEVDTVLEGRHPTFEELSKLPLLRNCLLEALRLYPAPPILIRRCINGDEVPVGPTCNTPGETIRFLPGQDIFISTWTLQRNPAIWGEDANKFDPSRWNRKIPAKGKWQGFDPAKVSMYPNEGSTDFAYVPFGGGPRKCVGDMFALMEAQVVMTSLLQRFSFAFAREAEGTTGVGLTTGATIHTKNGLNTTVVKRPDAVPVKRRGPLREDNPRMDQRSTLSVAQRVEPEALVVPTAAELRVLFAKQLEAGEPKSSPEPSAIEIAYEQCREITREHSKTFFLGSQLLATEEQRVVWAIYNWCRQTDELVDGPLAKTTTMEDLEEWEKRLDATFSLEAGLPATAHWSDIALADGARRFSLIQRPFQDMIGGMAMDLVDLQYQTFQELEVYCYRVAGTVGIMTLPVLGFDGLQNITSEKKEETIAAAMSLGMAFQLTNILRDIGEDGRRKRIYVPQEDLDRFGITREEVLEASHKPGQLYYEDRWREFMEFQFERCERYYQEAEGGIVGLSEDNRLGVMAALFVYRGILDVIRRNNYDNLSRRAYVDLYEKFLLMGQAWWRVQELQEVAQENIRSGRLFQQRIS